MYVYDIECLTNYFLVCFLDAKTQERYQFEISDYRNDIQELLLFLKQPNLTFIGFNNLDYDSQLIEFILRYRNVTASEIYNHSQKVIESEFPEIPEYKLKIPQIDLYKLNHWNNPAKRSSLKWLQFSIDFYNIEDMPLPHYHHVLDSERDSIASYCWNDVLSTFEIAKLSKEQILLRRDLSNSFKLNLLNSPEPTISKKIISDLLSKETGQAKRDIIKQKTFRHRIDLRECILPIVQFEDPIFQKVKEIFENTVLVGDKKTFKQQTNFKGIELHYGLGGIHGAVKGLHSSDEDYIIKSADVTSFYPMLAINNGFKPAHLPTVFNKLYYWFFTERKKYPKSNPLNYVYKIILNSTYGLSSDINSFLYDPLMTMQITVNGQLLLSMLIEQCSNIPNSQILMANTDGFEIKIPRKYQEQYDQICSKWCDLTNLQLEFVDYDRMIVRDVNNYIAIDTTGYIKCKGVFEFEDQKKKKINILHKNKSALVVAIAVYNYYINNVSIEQTIKNHTNIFDFCIGIRAKADAVFEARGVQDGKVVKEKLSKTIRYIISTNGVSLYKIYKDGSEETINVHPQRGRTWYQTILNKITDDNISNYNINFTFYIQEARKLIDSIESSQMTLL